jgi:manganese efflux pump family protein
MIPLVELWRLVAIVAPLALDSFAIAAALAAAGLSRSQRRRIALAFPAFETGMPLIGLALGRVIADAVGHAAVYGAAALLAIVGVTMLLERDEHRAAQAADLRGFAFVGLALAASLDELALGFTIGLLRLSLVVALVVIAVQAVVASQLGLALGARIGQAGGEMAEKLAGVALIVVGAVVFVLEL